MATVTVEGNHIVFRIPDGPVPDDFEYTLALQSCSTPERILAWAYHLDEKRWATPDVIWKFIKTACAKHGLHSKIPRA